MLPGDLLVIAGTLAASALGLGSLILRDQQRTREALGRVLPLARQLADALGVAQPQTIGRWGRDAWELELVRGPLTFMLRLHPNQQLQLALTSRHAITLPGVTIHALTGWRDMPVDLPPHAPLSACSTPAPEGWVYVCSPAELEPSIRDALRLELERWPYHAPYITDHQLRASLLIETLEQALTFLDDCERFMERCALPS